MRISRGSFACLLPMFVGACDRAPVPGRPAGEDTTGRGATVAAPAVTQLAINTGPPGMASRVRWLLSPDSRAIIAMDDPAGVEAEPVVNGFAYGNELTGTVLQVDGVWDVAPSPDWSKLAIGRGFILRGGETDSISDDEWRRLEMWLPQDVAAPTTDQLRAELRPHLFPASGMAYMQGIGLAQVIDLSRFGEGRVPVVEGPTLSLDGWRVRWTRDGANLAAGNAPSHVQDYSNPTRWSVVDAKATHYKTQQRSLSDSSSLVLPRWVEGPTIDVSVTIDLNRSTVLELSGARVESQNGTITRIPRGGIAHKVGPGLPLVATSSGRFILALVPKAGAGEYDAKATPVLYWTRER